MEKKYLSKDDLVGKKVIDSEAMIIGSVKDLSFNLEAKDIGLTITVKDGREITVSSGDMICVGDVVLLKKTLKQIEAPKAVEKVQHPPPKAKQGLCAVCGWQNDSNAKFCIKCGAKL
jgi:sporulation protein YlmC with PRC-barrel domain